MTTRTAVADFLHLEARLLDDHDYEAWLELWDDAGIYLIPANGEGDDPDHEVSIVYDNRGRLGRRVQQLQTGYRYAQLPQSRTQHFITNIELLDVQDERIEVRSAYMVMEARFGNVRSWAGRAVHHLIPLEEGGFSILRKTFVLVDNDEPVNTLAFLP